MNERDWDQCDWNELAGLPVRARTQTGRIEACARISLALAARLEDAGMLDGPSFSEQLRRSVQPQASSPAHLECARQVLHEFADALDGRRHQ